MNETNTATSVAIGRICVVPGDAPKKFAMLKNSRELTSPNQDAEFTAHLQAVGMLQPIGIAKAPKGLKIPAGCEYIVVWGNRRFLAQSAWLEKQIRAFHELQVQRAKENAGRIGKKLNAKIFRDSLKKKLAKMPSEIQAVIVEGDELELASQNFRENAARENLHWTDTARRAVMLSDAAMKRAGKSLPKSAGSGSWVAEMLGLSKSNVNNYMRVVRQLNPKLFELCRRKDGMLPSQDAIALAREGADADTEQERWDIQWEKWASRLEEPEPAESEDAGERVTRPSADTIEAKLADVEEGGYASIAPKKTPKGSADFVGGFDDGFSAGYNEAMKIALKFVLGKRKSFPKARG